METELLKRLEWHGQHLGHLSATLNKELEQAAEEECPTRESWALFIDGLRGISVRFDSTIDFYSALKRDVLVALAQQNLGSHSQTSLASSTQSTMRPAGPWEKAATAAPAIDPAVERLQLKIGLLQTELIKEQSLRAQAQELARELKRALPDDAQPSASPWQLRDKVCNSI